MANETREVTLRLGATLRTGGDDALRKLGRAAEKLNVDRHKAFKGLKDNLDQAARETGRLTESFDAMGKRLTTVFDKVSSAVRKSSVDIGRLGEKSARIGRGGAGRAGRFDEGFSLGKALPLGGLGGAGGAAAASLAAAVAIGGKIAEAIARSMPGTSLGDYNTMVGSRFGVSKIAKEKAKLEGKAALREGLLGWIPGSSFFLGKAKEGAYLQSDAYRVEQELRNREQVVRIQSARAANKAQRDIAMQHVGSEQAHYQALSRFGMSSASQQARIWEGGQHALDLGQEQILKRGAGYDRTLAMGDVAGTIAHGVALGQHDTEARRQKQVLAFERGAAKDSLRKAQASLADEQRSLSVAQRDVARGGNGEDAEELRRRMALEQQLVRVKEAQKVVDDAQAQDQRIAIQQATTLNQLGEQRLRLVQQESGRLRDIVREEKERETGRRESFGLLYPRKAMTYVAIGKKLKAGMPLTQRDIELAQSAPGQIFDERLKKIARDRTGKGSAYEQLRNMLPELGTRQANAQKALAEVKQQFHVEVKMNNAKEIADQLVKPVLAAISQAVNGIKTSYENELARQMNQMHIQQKNQFRGG